MKKELKLSIERDSTKTGTIQTYGSDGTPHRIGASSFEKTVYLKCEYGKTVKSTFLFEYENYARTNQYSGRINRGITYQRGIFDEGIDNIKNNIKGLIKSVLEQEKQEFNIKKLDSFLEQFITVIKEERASLGTELIPTKDLNKIRSHKKTIKDIEK